MWSSYTDKKARRKQSRNCYETDAVYVYEDIGHTDLMQCCNNDNHDDGDDDNESMNAAIIAEPEKNANNQFFVTLLNFQIGLV